MNAGTFSGIAACALGLASCIADPLVPAAPPSEADRVQGLCARVDALTDTAQTATLDGFPARHFTGETFTANPAGPFFRLSSTTLAILPEAPAFRINLSTNRVQSCQLQATSHQNGVLVFEPGQTCFVVTGPETTWMGMQVATGVQGTLVEGAMQWNPSEQRLDVCTRWRIDHEGNLLMISGAVHVAQNANCQSDANCPPPTQGTATCQAGRCRYTCECPLSAGYCTDLDCVL